MKPIDEMKHHAKEMGCEGLLDSLIEDQKPREPVYKPTKGELKHRRERRKKNKAAKMSRRKNRGGW